MAQRNPRSKLRTMKRSYFWTTAILYFALFIAFYLISEVLFTIGEVAPYARLTILGVFFVLVFAIVNYVVNHLWNDKWKREAPDFIDAIQVPEPEYVMDEETARRLEEKQRMEAAAPKKKGIFSRLFASLAPVEEESDRSVSSQAAWDSKTMTTESKAEVVKEKPSRLTRRKEQEALVISGRTGSSQKSEETKPVSARGWQTPLEEMKTAEIDEVLPVLEEHAAASAERKALRANAEKPARREQGNESKTLRHSKRKQTAEKSRREKKNDALSLKRSKGGRRSETAGGKPAASKPQAAVTEHKSSLFTPLDEMKTEELETAVEKAIDRGYNPLSNERNK